MTVRELKNKLNDMDDNCTITLRASDGSQKEITRASEEGDHLAFWTDSTS